MTLFSRRIGGNIGSILAFQIINVLFGFLVPKLLLETYGTAYHGLTATINNLNSYIMLFNGGLSTVAAFSLYQPFAASDKQLINSTLNAIKSQYRRTGLIYAFLVVIATAILPLLVAKSGLDSFVVTTLMLVTGIQMVLECFLVNTWRTLLQADQRIGTVYVINTIVFALRGALQIIAIKNHLSIVLVQVIPTVLVFVSWIALRRTITYQYPFLDEKISPDYSRLAGRKNALVHHLEGFVVNNSGVLILATFTSQIEVSIYAVYQMVISHLNALLVSALSYGTVADFGHCIASGDKAELRRKFERFELAYYLVSGSAYIACALLLLPFVRLYTARVSEIRYDNATIAVLSVLFAVLSGMRAPAITLVDAAGYYRETQFQAIIELFICLIIGVVLAARFKVVGVLLGLNASFCFRTIAVTITVHERILRDEAKRSFFRMAMVIGNVAIVFLLLGNYVVEMADNWSAFFIIAALVSMGSALETLLLFLLIEPKHTKRLINGFLRSGNTD